MSEVLWIDSHCHPQYESLGLQSIQDAYQQGVSKICCVGVELSEHKFLISCKEQCGTAIALGEHPMNDFSKVDWLFFEQIVVNYNAIGETGFDFQKELRPQIEAFERQADLAEKFDLPIILHVRDAGDGKIEELVMKEMQKFPKLKGVFHCFVGTQKLADFAIDRNFFISFSGIVTFKKCESIRQVMKTVPLDLFLIETDAPYLAPEPKRGKRNYPAYVKYTGEFIAKFLDLDKLKFSQTLLKNFDKLYF